MRKRLGWWLLPIFSVLLSGLQLDAGAAQTSTLAVVPAEGTIFLNQSSSLSLTLYATNVVDLIAYDITITYDPDILQLDSFANAGWLTPAYLFFLDNRPGFLQITYGKVGAPGVDGEGPLLNLVFSGVGFGTSDITIIAAGFSDRNGVVTHPTLQNGTVTTTYDPNTITYSSLSGAVSLQGQTVRNGIPVTLAQGLFVGQGPYTAFSLEQLGSNLFFDPVVMDAYPFTTAYPYYLNLEVDTNKVKGIVGISDTFPPLRLLAGNVADADNEINSEDLDLIKNWFDMTADDLKPGDELLGDANYDGVVDIRDLALAGGNFGMNASTAYMEWLP